MAKKKDKIEVEVEVGDREVEIEIDPETGDITVEKDGESADEAAPDEAEEEPKRDGHGPGLIVGVVLGGLAGAAVASAIVRLLAGAPSNGAQPPQDSAESASGGLMGQLRARWHEATIEGRAASQEATQQKLARYRELTGDEPKRGS